MLKTINLDINHKAILDVITKEEVKWFGWKFNDFSKDRTIKSINWGKNSDIGCYSLRYTKYQQLIEKAIPQLKSIKYNPKKSHITKTLPKGGLPWHKDYQRKKALLIPIGENKGSIMYNNFVFKYQGPTFIATNVLHKTFNDSKINRYTIQLHIE